ncbi:phosphoenolpyruvate--protein phosphotransferase [Shewanella intestini]|uniref:phosphoenolpyruvate--protein phosphotransferase n=1 Tax=Shewanella intestini TaxID=2017544 RepID=A0ABS5HYD7_9GAMM|nr:phosphoenolpyruvate--protein phosphotransferase [Shewanella sp. XMDDZSB0408]MBR9726636.1 phosphoenolpyruvate--protein phosphotransferase [Shewanella intestini]MRG34798.1 phosphoenolpyruvate--protein phosphotransferase [Shewanella sp. XMDDZSB0408]
MIKTLRDITQAVASAASFDLALKSLVAQTKVAMKAQCCSVYILEQQQLVLSATEGLSPSAIGQVVIPITEGLVGLVAQREELLNLADAPLHPRFKLFPGIAEEAYKAFLAAPIIYQKSVVGVIVVQQPRARQFDEGEEAFLMTLAAQLAVVLRALKNKAEAINKHHQVVFRGVSASKGIAIAKGVVFGGEININQPQIAIADELIEAEITRLNVAINGCDEVLSTLIQRFENENAADVASIFSAFKSLLSEQSLAGEYIDEIRGGWQAESAVSRVSLRYIIQFQQMDDSYLKERASDVRELGHKVLKQLIEPGRLRFDYDDPVILIAKDIDTTLLAEFPRAKLAGIVTEFGGVNAHTAILARALGIPAIVAVEQIFSAVSDNQLMVLNANRGEVLLSPTTAVVDEYRLLLDADIKKQQQFLSELSLPTETRDAQRIELFINAGLISGVESQLSEGADGIGLYRTEVPFMLQQRFPSELEQITVYRKVLAAAAGKTVVMRTLDIGGDKPLPYFPINEDNPFLGWRGIRLSLDHPELFLVQLRAMLQAAQKCEQLHILLPMVSNLDEIDSALAYLHQAYTDLNLEQKITIGKPLVGIMIEVPALLYQLAEVAQRVDFVSVGSNDLTQYLLAVDRNNPSVGNLFDSFHPGVLRALKKAVDDCHLYKLDISICGELAGEPLGALLLVAMGYNKLSMNQASLARVNYLLRRVHKHELVGLLSQVLKLSNATQVKSTVLSFIEQRQLADIIH